MYIPIIPIENTVSFVNDQRDRNDTVFNTRSIHSRYETDAIITNDKDYNKPDRSQFIFSTMGIGLNALYSNNMITPIRTKSTLNGYHMYGEIAKYIEHKRHIENGVYIVDYYNIYNDGTTEIESVIQYYLNSCNITYDIDVINNIIDRVNTRIGRTMPTEIKLRIITYIAEETINDLGYVYVPTSDLVICKGVIDNRVVHPNSKQYRSNRETSTQNNKNHIIIDIVDNESSNPYFIKIGNDTLRLYPSRDDSRVSGGRITINKNNAHISTTECKLHEIESVLGIYKTREEAVTKGDISKLNELSKLKLDKEKITLDYDKIRHEKEKILEERNFYKEKYEHELKLQEHKFKLSELDIAKKYIDHELAYNKSSLELKTTYVKHKIDTHTAIRKFNMEMTKLETDLLSKVISFVSSTIKSLS